MSEERSYYIDWLRVIAMLAVFFFHCTRFFDTEGWHLKNREQSEPLFVAIRFLIWPWVMELFFLLSGVGAWYMLRTRSARIFIWERAKRLLIPLYTAGLLVLLPPQFYFELLTNSPYRGDFWQILSRYFASFYLPHMSSWPETLLPIPFPGHLWFLQYLFMISLVSLPLLLYLKSAHGKRWITKLAGWCDRRGGIFLFVMPLALTLIGLRGLFEISRSWADFLWYTIFFVIGYILSADERFKIAVKKHGWICLALWILTFGGGIGILVLALGYDPYPGHESYSSIYVLYQIFWSISSWSAVVFMLSIGAKHLNSNNRILAYSNEAVLPFYLFHQTIILVVGYFVIPWNMGILPKLLIVSVISLPLIMVLYEVLIRRFSVMRFFFGMKGIRP